MFARAVLRPGIRAGPRGEPGPARPEPPQSARERARPPGCCACHPWMRGEVLVR